MTEDKHEDYKGEDTDFEPTTQNVYKDLDNFTNEHKIDIKVIKKFQDRLANIIVDITLLEVEFEEVVNTADDLKFIA